MFESAELGHKVSKETYEQEVPALRESLLDAQFELARLKKFSVVILIGGVDGAGKGETVNILNEWMDPRNIRVHAYGPPSDEEREKPRMWRFWRDLPPRGKMGIYFGSWYTDPILRRVYGEGNLGDFDRSIEEVVRFEKMLADEGILILKFWMHLSKEGQRARLKALEKDPETAWRVTEQDWRHFKLYDEFRKVSEIALKRTSRQDAPWTVVEGSDPRFRYLTVGRQILEALHKRLSEGAERQKKRIRVFTSSSMDSLAVLDSLDLSKKLDKHLYKKQLEKYQGRLNLLSRHPKFKNHSLIIVFEGNDAAGKGGSIRRITSALDARQYQVVSIAAPSEEEKVHPYLWRFWRQVPRIRHLTLFDRSWYGRVLVERVEGFCSAFDWNRAYSEINDFEEQLAQNNVILIKFWLAISKEEQLSRFKDREKTGFKRYKITEEDWRNRKKWNLYSQAVCEMIERTSTNNAPWILVEANDKHYARIKILKKICAQLEKMI